MLSFGNARICLKLHFSGSCAFSGVPYASRCRVYHCLNTQIGDQCQEVAETLGDLLWVVAVGVARKSLAVFPFNLFTHTDLGL